MPDAILIPSTPPPAATPLLLKFACPGEVFEELATAPPRIRNWLVPTLLVAVTNVMVAGALGPTDPGVATLGQVVEAGKTELFTARWKLFSAMTLTLAAFAATGWSALVFWCIGRAFLHARFSYWKAVEIVSLTGGIVALGAVVKALLAVVSNDLAARPDLSLFAGHLTAEHPARAALGALNIFHLWSTAVLVIGLSKVSGAGLKESAFWVFGYWLVLRLALILLS